MSLPYTVVNDYGDDDDESDDEHDDDDHDQYVVAVDDSDCYNESLTMTANTLVM